MKKMYIGLMAIAIIGLLFVSGCQQPITRPTPIPSPEPQPIVGDCLEHCFRDVSVRCGEECPKDVCEGIKESVCFPCETDNDCPSSAPNCDESLGRCLGNI